MRDLAQEQEECPHFSTYDYCEHCGKWMGPIKVESASDSVKESPKELENRKNRLLNAYQVEKMLNVPDVTERLIHQYARLGTLPSVKVGDEVLFDPLEIAEWVRIMRSVQARRSA